MSTATACLMPTCRHVEILAADALAVVAARDVCLEALAVPAVSTNSHQSCRTVSQTPWLPFQDRAAQEMQAELTRGGGSLAQWVLPRVSGAETLPAGNSGSAVRQQAGADSIPLSAAAPARHCCGSAVALLADAMPHVARRVVSHVARRCHAAVVFFLR